MYASRCTQMIAYTVYTRGIMYPTLQHRWLIHVRLVLMTDRLAHCRTHWGAVCMSPQASVSGLLGANYALSITTKFVQLANAPFIFGNTPEVGIVMFAPSDKAWAAAAQKIGEENNCAIYCSFVIPIKLLRPVKPCTLLNPALRFLHRSVQRPDRRDNVQIKSK